MANDDQAHVFEEPIQDVDKTTKSIIFKKHRGKTIAWLMLSVIWPFVILVLAALAHYSSDLGFIGFVAILPLILFGIWWQSIRVKVQSAFMEQFALANGFEYSPEGEEASGKGVVFSFGHDLKITDQVSGAVEGFPIKLYDFESTTGEGKYQEEHLFTIFEVTANHDIPQLFLNSKKAPFMSGSSDPVSLSRKNILKLEGDFNQHFDLFVPIEYEQEALQIFTPDIMAKLIDAAQDYDLEIVGRQVRIIATGFIDNTKDLNAMYAHARELINLFEKTLTKFNYQLIGDFSPELKVSTSPFANLNWQQILMILSSVMVIGVSLAIIYFSLNNK